MSNSRHVTTVLRAVVQGLRDRRGFFINVSFPDQVVSPDFAGVAGLDDGAGFFVGADFAADGFVVTAVLQLLSADPYDEEMQRNPNALRASPTSCRANGSIK